MQPARTSPRPQRRFKSEAASRVDVLEHERFKVNVHAGADFPRNIAVRAIVQRRSVIVGIEIVDAKSRHRKGCRFSAPRRTGDDRRSLRKRLPSGLATPSRSNSAAASLTRSPAVFRCGSIKSGSFRDTRNVDVSTGGIFFIVFDKSPLDQTLVSRRTFTVLTLTVPDHGSKPARF